MKVKIILTIIILFLLILNSAKGESNAQNITIQYHQVWDFSDEMDAYVIDTISTNENWTIPGSIGILQNSKVVNYFVYDDNANIIPEIIIYRPTIEYRVEVPNLSLIKNKTLTIKYMFLGASKPAKFTYFELNDFLFPFDEYEFLLAMPVQDYNQEYSADIIFPASFEIRKTNITSPLIESLSEYQDFKFYLTGIRQIYEIPISKSIEEYKFRGYIPSVKIPNKVEVNEKLARMQNQNKNFLVVEYTYGRPTLFILIFVVSVIFMLLFTYFSHPLTNKEKTMNYLLRIGSIWAGQEGASFLQGHRPLDITLYDFTIAIILIPLFLRLKPLISRLIESGQNKLRNVIRRIEKCI